MPKYAIILLENSIKDNEFKMCNEDLKSNEHDRLIFENISYRRALKILIAEQPAPKGNLP